MNVEAMHFPNIGFLQINLEAEELRPLNDEIKKIQLNSRLQIPANKALVGNIEKEFKLTESLDHINSIIARCIPVYQNNFDDFLSRQDILSEDRGLVVNSAWVNFQAKHEFNPVHDHTGVFSFVIWLKIPYDIGTEISCSPGANGRAPAPGHFSFFYTNSLGNICSYVIPADVSMENTLLLFPAKLTHAVYPFYSSDDYRISVSGNVVFKV
jgi:hypothetical protein